MNISVIIATKNRPQKIINCLKSILANNYRSFEILIADQSANLLTQKAALIIKSPKIKYFHLKTTGKSKAINYGLKKAKGKIIAFTDDDCLVTKNWLSRIASIFKNDQKISAVFGQSLPYQPQKNKGLFCACVLQRKQQRVFNNPIGHWQIGYGNNMAIRKKVFEKIGGFTEWLGPGTIGQSCDDAEITLRILVNDYQILYSPLLKVYHDRWLSKNEFEKQQLSYSLAETACYTYLSKTLPLARKVLFNLFRESVVELLKSILSFSFRRSKLEIKRMYFRIKGLFLGLSYSLKYHFFITTAAIITGYL